MRLCCSVGHLKDPFESEEAGDDAYRHFTRRGGRQPNIMPSEPVSPADDPGTDGRVDHSKVIGEYSEVEYVPEEGHIAKGASVPIRPAR